MAEKIKECKIEKEHGFLYYLDRNGNISRSKINRKMIIQQLPEIILELNIKRKRGYLYFIDKEGDISRIKMIKGRKFI